MSILHHHRQPQFATRLQKSSIYRTVTCTLVRFHAQLHSIAINKNKILYTPHVSCEFLARRNSHGNPERPRIMPYLESSKIVFSVQVPFSFCLSILSNTQISKGDRYLHTRTCCSSFFLDKMRDSILDLFIYF